MIISKSSNIEDGTPKFKCCYYDGKGEDLRTLVTEGSATSIYDFLYQKEALQIHQSWSLMFREWDRQS